MKILLIVLCMTAFGKNNEKKKVEIEKVPKSIFLIKKAKINAGVGEPQFYPADAQLRTISNDPLLHNTKKFE